MENIAEVVGFLEANNLPAQDIQANDSNVDLFQIKHQNRVIGTIGLEMYETVALLRSLAVEQSERNSWIGKKLVDHAEEMAKKRSVREPYLITDATPEYFGNLGYNKIKRSQAPEEIQKTSNSQCFVRRMQIL